MVGLPPLMSKENVGDRIGGTPQPFGPPDQFAIQTGKCGDVGTDARALWLIGFIGFSQAVGSFIHILILLAIVMFVIDLISGGRATTV